MSNSFEIQTSYEYRRGCGYRQPGGLYLVNDGIGEPCGKLPLPLTICPTCNGGIHPSRGWTWVNATSLFHEVECSLETQDDVPFSACSGCPMSVQLGRAGLLWVGGTYYRTTDEFCSEAVSMGVSRRIKSIPKGLEIGKTWVLLAHRKAITNPDGTHSPAIFHAYLPNRIEYIIKGDESDKKLQGLVDRGVTLIKVEKAEQQYDEESGKIAPESHDGFPLDLF